MELVERYLRAVSPGLPKSQRQDILAELGENLRSEMEAKADELGRPLTESEKESVLQHFGHPLVVAGRYQPSRGTFTFGRLFIGPELFPFYLKGVTVAVALAVIIVAGVHIAMAIAEPGQWSGILSVTFFHASLQFVIQTGIWVAIQSYYTRHPISWNAKSLPLPQGEKPRVSRAESIFTIVFSTALL